MYFSLFLQVVCLKKQLAVNVYEDMKVLYKWLQMKEEELLVAQHVGDVINILQMTTHHLFDPDELLTVNPLICP